MPDYSNGKIYKIVCNITGEIYIGSTTMLLCQRLAKHKSQINDIKCYTKSKDIILRGDYQIILIENYSCNNKEELCRKEREHIETNICINKNIPTRTKQEYRENTKEHKKETDKIYYNNNRDKIIKYAKDYRENNVEKKIETNRKYREANKDEINRKQREKNALKKLDKTI